jgi:hypothetical protein
MCTLLRVCMLCAAGVKEAEQEQPSAPEPVKVRFTMIQNGSTTPLPLIMRKQQAAPAAAAHQGGHSWHSC